MSEFYIRPAETQAQAESLWGASVRFRSLTDDIPAVIQELQEMTSFETEIHRLESIRQKAENQYRALQRVSQALSEIADSFRSCENRVLGRVEGVPNTQVAAAVMPDSRSLPSSAGELFRSTGDDEAVNATPWWSEEDADRLYGVGTQQMLPTDITDLFTVPLSSEEE